MTLSIVCSSEKEEVRIGGYVHIEVERNKLSSGKEKRFA